MLYSTVQTNAEAEEMKPDPYAKTERPSLGKVLRSEQAPQDAVDQHGANYDNDVPLSSWLRGAGEDATQKPGFDRGPSGNRYDKKGR